MEQREEIEMLFWEVIDGTAGEAEQARAAALLASSAEYRRWFEELKVLQQSIRETEPEQPSLRFSRNVMEHITASKPARPIRQYYNPWVLGLLGVFFVLALGMGLLSLWQEPAAAGKTAIAWKTPSWLQGWDPEWSSYFLFAAVPVGLLLLDALFHRRRRESVS